jgi:hypothetical protein
MKKFGINIALGALLAGRTPATDTCSVYRVALELRRTTR